MADSPNVVTVPVSLERPGWVVLADTYYPGWFAYVDGEPATLLRADYAFRAVGVGAGDHVVTFQYRPRSFYWGLWASGIGWSLWMGGALYAARRSWPRKTPAPHLSLDFRSEDAGPAVERGPA
jgi:uncharacterized membrane protein YfhO